MNRLKKAFSIILACAFTASTCTMSMLSVNAAKIDFQEVSSITQKLDDDGSLAYYDNNGNEVSVESLNDDSTANKTYPSKYDLRDYDRITSVKNQGNEGYCWAFASAAAIESNILTNPKLSKKIGENPAKNLEVSKTGTSWFIMTGIKDENSPYYNDYYHDDSKGSNGGWPRIIALGLNSGFGTYPETLTPYVNAKSGYSEYLRYYSDYHLKDYNFLSNDLNVIKDNIINNGAIAVYYHSANEGYSSDRISYCDNQKVAFATASGAHVVTIAGWDDNYSRDNFNGAVKPKNNGAWLCKNSWGEDSQDKGYFWISYESYDLQFNQFIMQDNSEYDNEYQHGFNFSDGWAGMDIPENANVFTADSNEQITQVSFGSMSAYNYEISVYKLNDNFTSPVDGTLLTTVSGKVNNIGFHNIDLPNDVFVESGDKFSVVVKGGDKNYIAFDSNLEKKHSPKNGYFNINGEWEDSVNCDYGYSSIKAFTKNVDNSSVKSLLKSTIKQAENIEISEEVDKQYIDALNNQIAESKKLLNMENVCAGDMNNSICLLNYRISAVADAVYKINSMDDYITLSKKLHNGEIQPNKIILNTDLNFNGSEIEQPLSNYNGSFTAEFIGNGHTISNAKIDAFSTASEGNIQGFFGILTGAKISNLNFSNITCNGSDKVGIVSSKADNSVFENISVSNCVIKMNEDYDYQQSAGICPQTVNCSITNCSVKNSKFYGNIVYELAGEYSNYYSSNTAENNELHSYGSIYTYNSENNKVKSLEVFINSNSNNAVVEKSKDGIIRFRLFSNLNTSIYGESVSYDKRDDWYYVDNDKSGDYAFVMYIYTDERPDYETDSQYAIDFDTYDAVLKSVVLNSSVSEVTLPNRIEGQNIKSLTKNFSFSGEYKYSIEKIIIPDSYNNLSQKMFNELFMLNSVKIGNGVKKIEDEQFAYFENLTTVELGNSIEEIGSSAFVGCKSLENISIPDSVKKIGNDAFRNVSFTKFVIGKSVTEIGENAIGYVFATIPWENDRYVHVPNVVINGYSGTAAEQYAKDNGIAFNNIDENEPDLNQEYYPCSMITSGDIDLDGSVTIKDATLIQKYLMNFTSLNDYQLAAAAVKGASDTLSIENATSIQKYVVNIYDTIDPSGAVG